MNTPVKAQIVVAFGAPLGERISQLPRPVDKQILARVKTCGVCYSDLHFHEGYIKLGEMAELMPPVRAGKVNERLVLMHE